MSFGFRVQGSEFLHDQGTAVHVHSGLGSSSSTGVDGAREALGELITTISELYEEHVPAGSVRMRFNKVKDLVDLQRGEKVATITSLKGISVTVEELSKRLERFKVRTVTVGGVVKEEPNGQAFIQIDSPGSRWFIHSA